VNEIDKNKREWRKIDEEFQKELKEIKKKLTFAYSRLNMESDDDLIESCIYEILSNEKRYDYIIKKLKAKEVRPA